MEVFYSELLREMVGSNCLQGLVHAALVIWNLCADLCLRYHVVCSIFTICVLRVAISSVVVYLHFAVWNYIFEPGVSLLYFMMCSLTPTMNYPSLPIS